MSFSWAGGCPGDGGLDGKVFSSLWATGKRCWDGWGWQPLVPLPWWGGDKGPCRWWLVPMVPSPGCPKCRPRASWSWGLRWCCCRVKIGLVSLSPAAWPCCRTPSCLGSFPVQHVLLMAPGHLVCVFPRSSGMLEPY